MNSLKDADFYATFPPALKKDEKMVALGRLIADELHQTVEQAYLRTLTCYHRKWVLYHTETQTTARIITTLTRGEQCHREKHRERLQEADSLHGITITICRELRILTATFGSGPVDYAL